MLYYNTLFLIKVNFGLRLINQTNFYGFEQGLGDIAPLRAFLEGQWAKTTSKWYQKPVKGELS